MGLRPGQVGCLWFAGGLLMGVVLRVSSGVLFCVGVRVGIGVCCVGGLVASALS